MKSIKGVRKWKFRHNHSQVKCFAPTQVSRNWDAYIMVLTLCFGLNSIKCRLKKCQMSEMCLCSGHNLNSNNDNVKKSKNQGNVEQPASVFMRFWSQRGLTPEQHDILSPSLALCMNHSLSLLHLHTHTFTGTLCWHVFQTEWQPLYPSAKSRAPPKQSQKPNPKTQCKAHTRQNVSN